MLGAAKDNKVICPSDSALPAIHESSSITLEDFIRMNNLHAFKLMSDLKYLRIVAYALALINYRASLDQAASKGEIKMSGKVGALIIKAQLAGARAFLLAINRLITHGNGAAGSRLSPVTWLPNMIIQPMISWPGISD